MNIKARDPIARHLLVFVDGIDVTNLCSEADPQTGRGRCFLPRNGRPYYNPVLDAVPSTEVQGIQVFSRPGSPAWVQDLFPEVPADVGTSPSS